MRLIERVHIVGSGSLGFDMTDPFDCHVYVIDGGEELALIDAGSGMGTGAILKHISEDGLDPDRIRHIILTHGHADHSGGAAALRGRFGAKVYAASVIADAIRNGDRAALGYEAAVAAKRYPSSHPLEPCEVDVPVDGETELSFGDLGVKLLFTPGHSAGDVCVVLDHGSNRSLFTGDLLFYGGAVVLHNMVDCRLDVLARSLRILRPFAVDSLFPGHLQISLSDGQRHIERANRYLDRLRIPDQLPIPFEMDALDAS